MSLPEEGKTAVWLPEDLHGEILLRVKDVADLFHCARTCRRWSRLVADVRRRRWPGRTSTSFLSGFLTRNSFAKSLVPTPRSVFGSDHRILATFFPEDAGTRRLLKGSTPLVARHGLLLLRLHPSNAASLHLAVCNLLVGTCDVLPPLFLEVSKYSQNGYAILTSADCSSDGKEQPSSSFPSGYSPLSKVLVIYSKMYNQPCTIHTFSCTEARWWNTPTYICGVVKHANAVVCQSKAHWLVCCKAAGLDHGGLFIISVDVKTCHVSQSKVFTPPEHNFCGTYYDGPQLTVAADGRLSLLYLQRPGLGLRIWVKQDNGWKESGAGWRWSRAIDLKPPEDNLGEEMHLTYLAEKGGTLLVKDKYKNVYTADLETGVMEFLTNHNQVTNQKIVPFEIYWPIV